VTDDIADGWLTHHGRLDDDAEPERFLFCPECSSREFGIKVDRATTSDVARQHGLD